MSFRKIQWFFPIAIALHNSEEAIFIPKWVSAHNGQLPFHPAAGTILTGLLLLTVAAFVVTTFSIRSGKESIWTYLLFGAASTMFINVFVPHIPATLVFGEYTPGVVTAVLINLPFMSALLFTAVRDRWVSGVRAVGYALLTPLAIGGFAFILLASF